jgi:transcriptional repressor NrdR
MRCPKCKNIDTKVIDSRLAEDSKTIRRRRECEMCEARFTTFERMEFINFPVKKANGETEMFDRSKVMASIGKALYKRNVDINLIEGMVNDLESEWAANKRGITSKRIGKDILRKLKDIDQVAYIRYASIYHNFENVNLFIDFISSEFD